MNERAFLELLNTKPHNGTYTCTDCGGDGEHHHYHGSSWDCSTCNRKGWLNEEERRAALEKCRQNMIRTQQRRIGQANEEIERLEALQF